MQEQPSPLKFEAPEDALSLDVQVYYAGAESCAPGHKWGPLVRDHFVLHAVEAGAGVFECAKGSWRLESGWLFLIRPGAKAFYQADAKKPWSYRWIAFNGPGAGALANVAGFGASPVLKCERAKEFAERLGRMAAASRLPSAARTLAEAAALLDCLSLLAEANGTALAEAALKSRKELRIQRAMEFIEMNYARDFSVAELAAHVGVDRSHLCHLFKQVMNSSPSSCLSSFRIRKACELLDGGALSVKETAYSVGFKDPLFFSRTFKRIKGVAPLDYKRRGGV